jgi:hypothetical protein
MADPEPQNQEKSESRLPASPRPQDYYSTLMKVINDVTNDHTLLRKLVYALAWQNLKPEAIVTRPIAQAQTQAKTIFELEQALELERAIERIEATAAGEAPKQVSRPQAFGTPENAGPEREATAKPAEREATPQPVENFDPAVMAEKLSVAPNDAPEPALKAAVHESDTSFEPPQGDNRIVTLTEQRAWPERKDVVHLERIPSWLDPSVRVSLDTVEYAPIHRPLQGRSNFATFAQLIAASMIGVVLYIGISGWVYLGRQSITDPAPATAPPQAVPNSPTPGTANQVLAPAPRPEPQPILPFPTPRTYGVYAGSPGQLFELEQLPIKVPDPRVLVSAEITKPSRVTTPADLSFVVFRRDLANIALQTATVRVVARVQRSTKFVEGKPTIVPLDGIWRIRSKAYEFKVSPLEGHNEMVVIQPNPGFVFPPGRYALVLNGFGYDFTVDGKITSSEQCLEQVEVVNGAVLSECAKS